MNLLNIAAGRRAVSPTSAALIVVVILLAVMAAEYVDVANTASSIESNQQGKIDSLQTQLKLLNSTFRNSLQTQLRLLNQSFGNDLHSQLHSLNSSFASSLNNAQQNLQKQIQILNSSLAKYAVNQPPIARDVLLTWTKDLSTQDRFFGGPIVVNQGDTVRITFISNDTVAHTFTLSSPYNYQINASLPGMVNDLTGKNFTTRALNNSPGVVVSGTSGNMTAKGSFLAKYAGIYEYTCIYHVNVGMVGFLIVLPNAAYTGVSTASSTTVPRSPRLSHITVLNGSGLNVKSPGYSPQTVTVVIGVNNTVSWTNDDTIIHTVTATDGSYNSGTIPSGRSWNYTYTTAGTYNYFCQYHPWMRGTVVVKTS